MRLPDFIIAGAPRSGTTWLRDVLAAHPGIAMATPARPEPKFFLVDELYALGLEHYSERWFATLPEGAVVGEKSTNYLENAHVAARIHGALPSVKLIFVLREPAERAYSNYRWTRRNGLEPLEFCAALDAESSRERAYGAEHRYARPFSYRSRGLYAELLTPWLERFAREQVLVLRFDDLVHEPEHVTAALHGFLGLESRPADGAALGAVNRTESPSDDPPCLDRLRAWYEPANRELAQVLGWDDAWKVGTE